MGVEYSIFYHYTTKEGKDAILDTRVIRGSRTGYTRDARFGEGVYLTTMDPETFTKKQVALNNWDSSRRTMKYLLKQGKVDYALKLKLPSSSVTEVLETDRNIFLHEDDINLNKIEYEVIRV